MANILNNIKILVVEDDPDMLNILVEFLKLNGAQVTEASNGQVALQILKDHNVDLVISDVKMPVLNGLELLKAIRAKDANLPIVFLTSGHSNLDEESAAAYGARVLIAKPFNLQLLLQHIKKAFPEI